MEPYDGILKTEGVFVEMNPLDTLKHLLALIYLQIVQIPPTFPPTLFIYTQFPPLQKYRWHML